eukprot:747123-Hanusia_phi.AAC.6
MEQEVGLRGEIEKQRNCRLAYEGGRGRISRRGGKNNASWVGERGSGRVVVKLRDEGREVER